MLAHGLAGIIWAKFVGIGFASTIVGAINAGAVIMDGMLNRSIPLLVRRVITIIPAVVIVGFGIDPTQALIVSQVILLAWYSSCAYSITSLATSSRSKSWAIKSTPKQLQLSYQSSWYHCCIKPGINFHLTFRIICSLILLVLFINRPFLRVRTLKESNYSYNDFSINIF